MADPVYYGVVKGNVVLLPEGVQLSEGLRVEIRAAGAEAQAPDEAAAEALFLADLQAAGLLLQIPPGSAPQPVVDRRPIRISGPPLSQAVIEDRR